MGSLIRKAERYLETLGPDEARRRLRVVRREELDADRDDGISADERERINAQIEEAVAASRIAVTPETLRVTPKRRGGFFPLVVNLLAIAVVAGGVVVSLYAFRRSEESIVAPPAAIATAEGKLLDAVKQESREKLEGKDREIASIREKLAGVDEEKERIRREATERVRSREKELEAELGRALAEERRKLQGQGLSEEAVSRRLEELESRSRTELASSLDEYRRRAEAERAEREKTVERLRLEYERSLSAAQGERARLAEESAKRQAELEAGYRQKQLALEKDKAAAVAELDSLRQQQRREQLVLDQFLAFYRRASDEVRAGRLGGARSVLAEFRRYLDEPSVASIEGVARRRSVELFLIESLEEAIATREGAASTAATVQSLTASANLVSAVAALVQQGDALYADRDYARARDLYLSAMARIPAVQVGYQKLSEIQEMERARDRAEVGRLLEAAGASYRAGDYAGALRGYGRALEALQAERGTVDVLLAQLQEIGSRLKEAELAPRMATAQRDLDARTRELAASQADVAALRAEISKLQSEAPGRSAGPDPALQKLTADLREREAEATALKERIGERDGAIASLQAEIAALRGDVAGLEGSLESREAAVGEREKTIATLAANVAGLQAQNAGLLGQIAGLKQSLESRDARLGALQARDAERAGRAGAAQSLRARAAGAFDPQAGSSSRAALLALLETKLLVQRILLSDAVLAEYPDLYEGLERYLEALVAEKQTEARTQTLRDLDALLGRLLGAPADEAALVGRYASSDQNALLLGILDKLGRLVQ